ncbi:Tim10/DDP family zinc finger-domain-containing protein [Annulohypoxylon maeteangense]|uniref:Tim10/DDP family zinc finger-domain-containing protein n=1 Tax=Annulohypoxylon maeteangense TaxID=1927788 RepID=UPI002007D315|nr:Tim10/DDP family zinc finger-domain-containing protein [Annulohypoxylon maeteangense]KAI0887262.1 Tim10/DDP family zinc finger-domain-containing protein [Annulohypoxylon maeteangense]
MTSDSLVSELKHQVQESHNLENAKQLIERLNEHCFEKCIPKPGTTLSNSEKTCLTSCMDKYLNAWNLISTVHITRLQRER